MDGLPIARRIRPVFFSFLFCLAWKSIAAGRSSPLMGRHDALRKET
jgi:hypothetical protein